MQININQEEAKVLLAGIRMYYANMKQCNEDMLEREYRENDREKYARSEEHTSELQSR